MSVAYYLFMRYAGWDFLKIQLECLPFKNPLFFELFNVSLYSESISALESGPISKSKEFVSLCSLLMKYKVRITERRIIIKYK